MNRLLRYTMALRLDKKVVNVIVVYDVGNKWLLRLHH